MHKTLYVDVDEEITSIIDRIRAEDAAEIFLVVPKDAMLTQGVINLKLLKKEIDKIGKSVMIATSDPQVKKVIERLGIKTKEMSADMEGQEPPKEKPKTKAEAKEEEISQKATNEVAGAVGVAAAAQTAKKQMDIGSDNFFDGASAESLSSEIDDSLAGKEGGQQPQMAKAAVASSPNVYQGEQLKKELYSKKSSEVPKKEVPKEVQLDSGSPISPAAVAGGGMFAGAMKQQVPQVQPQSGPSTPAAPQKVSVANGNPGKKDLFGNVQDEDRMVPTKNGFGFGKVTDEKKAEKFFSKGDPMQAEQKKVKKEVEKEKKRKKSSSKLKVVVPVLILVVLLVAGGAWVWVNYPKVEISIHPKKEDLSKEIKIVAKEGASADEMEQGIISGKQIEVTVGKTMEFDATGEAFESDDGKARGKVTIYNKFSSSPQPLVETTRVLSKEDKLFRLVEDVTVPGMDGESPGMVEVDVIADKPGEDFNITASTFTIEGFKGGPKYEKFEVTSKVAMTDGGSPDSNKKLAMVTQEDLDAARKETIDELEKVLEQEVSSQLEGGAMIIIDSAEKEIVSAESSQKDKDVANKFTYTVDQKVKAIAFSDEDVNFLVMKELESDVNEGYSMDSVSNVTFKKGISDFDNKAVTMYVDANAVAWPVIDKGNLTRGIVGKKEDEVKTFLANYPEIEKVEITVTPSWLSTIPVSPDKVAVIEVK